VRDDRGKFAIRLFARAEREIGAVARKRGAEEAAVEEEEARRRGRGPVTEKRGRGKPMVRV